MTAFYITTPIYYVNAKPHLGHIYTTLLADTLARYHRQCGEETFFSTGTDEHGQKIERAAEGIPVKEHVDKIVSEFKEAFDLFGIQPDHWIRTTDECHKQGAQHLFRKVQEAGYIYKGSYNGWYCTECGEFKEEVSPNEAPWCEIHERLAEFVSEESYFFKLSEFSDRLLSFYQEHPEFIQPETRRNEVISFVSGGLKDLCISRVSVKWGIPVLDDPEHTLYVWFDALSNYITTLGYGNDVRSGFDKFWPAATHLVGKDILRFHAVYWPAFLMAAGIELPKQIFAHGMWLSGGRKMSKTLGNVIDLKVLLKYFTREQVRYFCLREMSYGQDGEFTYKILIDRVNSDLAAGLGNLASRTLTMIRNYFDGKLPSLPKNIPENIPEKVYQDALAVELKIAEKEKIFIKEFNRFATSRALEAIWEMIAVLDKYLSDNTPWKLAKDPAAQSHLLMVLHVAFEGLRHIAVFTSSVFPESMQLLWNQLGYSNSPSEVNPLTLTWSSSIEISIGEIKGLFPKMDKEKIMSEIEKDSSVQVSIDTPENIKENNYIGIDDFVKVEIKVGQILEAERVPKADKLLRLQIDLGETSSRQILAGIAEYYTPEELLGLKIAVIANLEPRKLRGFESQGMVLAVSNLEGKPILTTFPQDVPNGARLK